MNTDTMTRVGAAEALIDSFELKVSIGKAWHGGGYLASCYWPNNDVVRDARCHGHGATLAAAIADMEQKVEEAKAAIKPLNTAAECKDAVIALIREHDAAPASFRDAVDALPVAK